MRDALGTLFSARNIRGDGEDATRHILDTQLRQVESYNGMCEDIIYKLQELGAGIAPAPRKGALAGAPPPRGAIRKR